MTDDLQEKTLKWYQEHHRRIDWICSQTPRILVFDMHSYSDEIVPQDYLQTDQPTPDICIGVDDAFTPPALTGIVKRRFEEAGYSTSINYPYRGCLIPNAVLSGASPCDCISVMLEINKRIYCDPSGQAISEKFLSLQKIVQTITNDCVIL